MKEVVVDSLGFKVPTLYYESIDEVNKDGNDANTALNTVNDYLDFHGARDDARELICEIVEEKTGIERAKIPTGNKAKDGTEITTWEKAEPYVNRALALSDGKVSKEDLQEIITQRARGYTNSEGEGIPAIAVSAKPRIRKAPQPKKLAAKFLENAKRIIAESKIDLLNQRAQPVLGKVFTFDGTPDAEKLGWFIKEYSETVAAQAAAV